MATRPPHPAPVPQPLPLTAPWEYELDFPRDPRAPGIARITLRAVLAVHGLEQLADRAELLTSELATNAVRHAPGPATVRIGWDHPVLRVSVADAGPYVPIPAPAVPETAVALDAVRGRGMLILDLIAHRWGGFPLGVPPFPAEGKIIWFELRLDAGAPPPGSVPALVA
ncbi:ATP-binding protein [Streptomyces sp. URMC 126]|uniref:ATP-binding protein n=1 Tax=Streptomyces sp. URMC 126 TaxID=3423401 RepID=UPI003F1A4AD2